MTQTFRGVIARGKGEPVEVVDVRVPDPGPGEARVTVQACGVCHSDMFAKEGVMGDATPFPIVPGHEIVGVVDALGENVRGAWKPGDRVGVGWFGGACYHCESCRRGDFITCANGRIPGVTFDGGYADAVVVPADALARVPEELSSEEAAPLLCAGVTTYHALRSSVVRPGDRVAVLGIGGLGHLAIQFAAIAGGRVIAVDVIDEKLELVRELGADLVVDARETDPVAAIHHLGGADVAIVLAVAPTVFDQAFRSLNRGGRLVLVSLPAEGTLTIPVFDTVLKGISIIGSIVGTRQDLNEALQFAADGIVHASTTTHRLDDINRIFDDLRLGRIDGRAVLSFA